MFSRPRHPSQRLLQGLDGVLFALALLAAYWLRADFPWWDLPPLQPPADYLWLLPICVLLAPALLASQGIYSPARPLGWIGTVLRILQASVLHILCLVLILFLARMQCARSVIILGSLLGGTLVCLLHSVLSEGWRASQANTLWIGTPEEVRLLHARLTPEEAARLPLSAQFNPATDPLSLLSVLVHRQSIGLVILSLPGLQQETANAILALCEEEGLELILRPGFGSLSPSHMSADIFAGEPVLFRAAQDATPVSLLAKRLLDRSLSTLLLLGLLPLLLLLALLIRLDSPGSILFRQRRAGLNGRPFVMYKFRSMQADAEVLQPSLDSRNEMKGPVFKLKDDPRITKLGHFLRRHSLDELPQLLNVVRGEMSLVGPRPLPLSEVDRFQDNAHRRRLSVKPGMTCLWQISGRNDITDFEEWVRLDLDYIDHWSLWLDLVILLRTIPVVLSGNGAR